MTDTVHQAGAFRFRESSPGHEENASRTSDAAPTARRGAPTRRVLSRPILRRQPLRVRDIFLSHREPDARAAVVLARPRGDTRVYPAGRQPSTGELLWAVGGMLYEVDTRLHHASVRIDLPALRDEFPFSAAVDIEWRVADPERVVRDGIEDVVRALLPTLRGEMANVTRRRGVDQVEDAERAALEAISAPEVGARYGLACTFWLHLSSDRGTVEHAGAKRELEHKIEIERLTQRLRELEQTNNQALLATKVEAYRVYMESGRFDQAALRLAQNPGDAAAVAELLRAERDEERRQAIDFIHRLVESDAIDRWQIEETVSGALKWLQEAVDNVIRPSTTPINPAERLDGPPAPQHPTQISSTRDTSSD